MDNFIKNFRGEFESYSKINLNDVTYNELNNTLINNPNIDMVSKRITEHLIPNNISWMKKNKLEQYYVEIEIKRYGDINTNFYLDCENKENVKVELILYNNEKIVIDNDFILVVSNAPYTPLYIRFTFNDQPFELKFIYDEYMCQTYLRQKILNSTFSVSGLVYFNGFARLEK